MPILADNEIRQALLEGRLIVSPAPGHDQVAGAKLELHLGTAFARMQAGSLIVLDPTTQEFDYDSCFERFTVAQGEHFVLWPGDFVHAQTWEQVGLAPTLCAELHGRSTLARLGLQVHQTAGFVDPNWNGQLTLELSNVGKAPLNLSPGLPIASLVFQELTSFPSRPYAGRYQHQTQPTIQLKGR